MLTTTNLSKVIEAVSDYAEARVDDVIQYQESQGYICLNCDTFIRAILKADDVGECKHLYFYTYLQKEFVKDEEEKTLDLSEVLIQEVYLYPDNNFELFEHGYGHPLEQEELDKAVWKSSTEETPIWAKIMELC